MNLCFKYRACFENKLRTSFGHTDRRLRNIFYLQVVSIIAHLYDLCTNPVENVFSPMIYKNFTIKSYSRIESPSVPVPTNLESTLDRETLSPSLSLSQGMHMKVFSKALVTGCIFCAPSGLRQGQVFTPQRPVPVTVSMEVPRPPPPPRDILGWSGVMCHMEVPWCGV